MAIPATPSTPSAPSIVAEATPEKAVPACTALILAVLLAGSFISYRMQGLERIEIPGLSVRLSSYLTVMVEEWLLVLLVWWALRRSGVSVKELIVGKRKSWMGLLEDFAFAIAFLVGWTALAGAIGLIFKLAPSAGARSIIPRTAVEALVFFLLACTAGFCEELIFRGYLQRQFRLWIGTIAGGIVIQGIVFGLAHGYHGWKLMSVIALEGCCLGLMARWRGSLRTVMIAHAMQDSLALLAYATGMQ